MKEPKRFMDALRKRVREPCECMAWPGEGAVELCERCRAILTAVENFFSFNIL